MKSSFSAALAANFERIGNDFDPDRADAIRLADLLHLVNHLHKLNGELLHRTDRDGCGASGDLHEVYRRFQAGSIDGDIVPALYLWTPHVLSICEFIRDRCQQLANRCGNGSETYTGLVVVEKGLSKTELRTVREESAALLCELRDCHPLTVDPEDLDGEQPEEWQTVRSVTD